jgi:hypothetical protein
VIILRHHDPPLDGTDTPFQYRCVFIQHNRLNLFVLQDGNNIGDQYRIITPYKFFHKIPLTRGPDMTAIT